MARVRIDDAELTGNLSRKLGTGLTEEDLYFELRGRWLYYFKIKPILMSDLPQGAIDLRDSVVENDPSDGRSWSITAPALARPCRLTAEDGEEREQWVQKLRSWKDDGGTRMAIAEGGDTDLISTAQLATNADPILSMYPASPRATSDDNKAMYRGMGAPLKTTSYIGQSKTQDNKPHEVSFTMPRVVNRTIVEPKVVRRTVFDKKKIPYTVVDTVVDEQTIMVPEERRTTEMVEREVTEVEMRGRTIMTTLRRPKELTEMHTVTFPVTRTVEDFETVTETIEVPKMRKVKEMVPKTERYWVKDKRAEVRTRDVSVVKQFKTVSFTGDEALVDDFVDFMRHKFLRMSELQMNASTEARTVTLTEEFPYVVEVDKEVERIVMVPEEREEEILVKEIVEKQVPVTREVTEMVTEEREFTRTVIEEEEAEEVLMEPHVVTRTEMVAEERVEIVEVPKVVQTTREVERELFEEVAEPREVTTTEMVSRCVQDHFEETRTIRFDPNTGEQLGIYGYPDEQQGGAKGGYGATLTPYTEIDRYNVAGAADRAERQYGSSPYRHTASPTASPARARAPPRAPRGGAAAGPDLPAVERGQVYMCLHALVEDGSVSASFTEVTSSGPCYLVHFVDKTCTDSDAILSGRRVVVVNASTVYVVSAVGGIEHALPIDRIRGVTPQGDGQAIVESAAEHTFLLDFVYDSRDRSGSPLRRKEFLHVIAELRKGHPSADRAEYAQHAGPGASLPCTA